MSQTDVLITGLGVVSSIGIGADEFFAALLDKRSGITSLANRTDEGAKPGTEPDDVPPGLWIGGPVLDFDGKRFVRPRKALKVMCREIQTAYAASQMAIETAGLASRFPAHPDSDVAMMPADVGTVFGSEMYYGPASEMEDAMRACFDELGNFDDSLFGAAAMKKVLPLWMLKYLPNMPACHVGIALGAHGPNNTLVLGDVSGPAAMIEAASCLGRGIAKVMIAGASGTRINTTRLNYRGDLPIADVADPLQESSRPYDPSSNGVVGGEAGVAMVLESEPHAIDRGAKAMARIVAQASRFVASGGMKMASRQSANDNPNARGSTQAIELAMRGAMDSAGLTSDQIGLIVGHGSGDPVIDRAERMAIQNVLPGVCVSAPAASLGHTGAASGSIGLATGVLAITRGICPPTLCPAASVADLPLLSKPTSLDADHVICLSHTSEGNATAVILARP